MHEPVYNRHRLGLNVRMQRHLLHLTQADLAQRMECCSQTLSLIERGKRDISVDTLFRLSRALECTPADLLANV